MKLEYLRAIVFIFIVLLPGCTGIGRNYHSSSNRDYYSHNVSSKIRLPKCLSAEVPNPNPQPNESTSFYGNCSNNKAINGIVVWNYKGTPVDIDCITNSSFQSKPYGSDSFESCNNQWHLLPNYCKKGSYNGQCINGVPNGVGFDAGARSDGTKRIVYVKYGLFSKGNLKYGTSRTTSGCGMAGCSGDLIDEIGWFDGGNLQFSCDPFFECINKMSGKPFIDYLALPKSKEEIYKVDNLRRQNNFDGWYEAFKYTGDRNDLKSAQKMANTLQQKALIEYMLMRVAGFDKAFILSYILKNGKQTASMNDSKLLFGLIKGLNANLPLDILWDVSQDKKRISLLFGQYKVNLKVGVSIDKNVRTCFLGICNNHIDTKNIWKYFEVNLNSRNKYKESGVYELNINSNNEIVKFMGATSASNLEAIRPILAVENLELIQ